MGLIETINARMNGGRCPVAGSLGECAAIGPRSDTDPNSAYVAHLYLWPAADNLKPAEVAQWFLDAGCINIAVIAVLHDEMYGITDGHDGIDGVRPWRVIFDIPDDKLQVLGFA